MNILLTGGSGTLGRHLHAQLTLHHTVINASRTRGDLHVDITSAASIENLYRQAGPLDACICVAASGAMDDFTTLTEQALLDNMRGKLFGQVNLVLIGQRYLRPGGFFTLTSGIFADEPARGVTGGSMISGALHSFVLSAALELPNALRINCVSPGMVEDSAAAYGHLFPGLTPVPMVAVVNAYLESLAEHVSGKIFRVYR